MGKNIVNLMISNVIKEEPLVREGYGTHKMKVPKGMLESLDPEQISYLAQLQLDLEKCVSDYRVLNVYKKSQFIASLSDTQRKEFKK